MPRKTVRKRNSVHDEGEPQTSFLKPGEGGSYIRNKDGSLTRVEHPSGVTKPTQKASATTRVAAAPRARKATAKKSAKASKAAAAAAEAKTTDTAKASEE